MTTTERPQKIWSTIDVAKIGAGALAAVSAAVAASSLGVAGTLGGAAVASVIGSLGTELYANSLKRGYGRLRKAKPGLVQVPRTGDAVPVAPAVDPDADPDATRAIPVTSASAIGAAAVYGPVTPPKPRWKRVVLLTVAVFVLAMTAIWLVEVVAGESLAAVFGNDTSGTTTIGTVVGDDSGADTPAPAVSTTPTDGTDVTPSPTTTVDPAETSVAPDVTPTADATTAPTETEPPAPAITEGPGTGTGELAPATAP